MPEVASRREQARLVAGIAARASRDAVGRILREREKAAARIRDALSQLQMAFARESQGVPEPPPDAPQPPGQEPAPEPPAGEEQPGESAADEAERAKARAKIWTPPGT